MFIVASEKIVASENKNTRGGAIRKGGGANLIPKKVGPP